MALDKDAITWTCHICGNERPDAQISVETKPLIINGQAVGQQNIRYCNDNAECVAAAADYDFFKSA